MKTIIDDLLDNQIVENTMPESLKELFLGFFKDEEQEEIMKFIDEKLKYNGVSIPCKLYIFLEFMVDNFTDEIYELEEYFYSGETDDNSKIYLN